MKHGKTTQSLAASICQLLVIQRCCPFCVGSAVFARFEGVFFSHFSPKAEIDQGALLHIVLAGGSVVWISTLVTLIFGIFMDIRYS